MKGKKTGFHILCLCISFLFCFSGCGKSQQPDDYAVNEGYETSDAQETSENKMDAGEIKVGVLYLGDPAEGAGYTYTHELGIEGMQNNLGLEESQIIRKINIDDADETATKQALQECVDEGCNIIFSTSWGYMQATSDFAEKYPDIYFSHATGYMSNGKNFNNYFGRIYQARYLSGIVAGKNTKTNKLGYVAAQGLDNSEVTGGINAFAMGAASVNPDVKVYVKVTGSWYAPEAEEAAARKLLDAGCDVIAQHCDAASLQKIAQDKGAYSIGYNSDMSKEAPKACLCSVIWNWSAYYTYAVQSVLDGTWDGANYFGGLEEGLVDITEPADFCADGTKEAVEQVKSEILAGENHVFEGELETNTGETIGKKGEVFSDEDITGKMSWYYKNVKVLN